MSIVANVKDIPQNHIAIQYHDELNQYFFEFEIVDQQATRFWLNIISNPGSTNPYFVFDFFGTGEIYVSVPPGQSLVSVSKKFLETYIRLFLGDNAVLRTYPKPPYEFLHLQTGRVKAARSPGSPINEEDYILAWHFLDTDYFYTVDTEKIANTNNKPKSPIICKYYTTNSSNLTIKSSYYKFANIPENSKVCSHPNISVNGFSICPFQSANPPIRQSSCSVYSPDFKVLKSTIINTYNTDQKFSIDLQYSLCMDGSHAFTIRNMKTEDIVNSFYYSPDNNFDELYFEVEKIYFEYISCYVNDNVSNAPTGSSKSSIVPKQSYILSLLGSE